MKPRKNEYEELREAGLTDAAIKSFRDTGADHRAILYHAREGIWKLAEMASATDPEGKGWNDCERIFAREIIRLRRERSSIAEG